MGTSKRVLIAPVSPSNTILRIAEPVALTTPMLTDDGTGPVWIEAPSGDITTDTAWAAKGDLIVGTANNAAAILTVGANDTIPMADSTQTTGLKWVASQTPSTQAFSDAAAQGTADTYARGDHKHAMMADPTGGSGWTAVSKTADEDVSSNTTPQDDNHLFFTSASGGYYIWEAYLIISSPVGGTTPDIKMAWGEDNTFRGWWTIQSANSAGTAATQNGSVQLNQTVAAATDTQAYVHLIRGGLWGGGGTFKLQWAQNTSGSNATRVHNGSLLRYLRLI